MTEELITWPPFQNVLDSTAPYRRFATSPSGIFIKEVVEHIRATGRPETFKGLYHGKIPKDAKYSILWKIQIDGKKRLGGDMAPCPMCTPNRFLDGVLAWFPNLQIAAVIGHCCADHANQAEREFKKSETKRQQEDYLLAALPHLDSKIDVICHLQPAATEALRIYRSFRKRSSGIQRHLRQVKQSTGGRLRVTEILWSKEHEEDRDYFGPAGFRGRSGSEVETRDHELGTLRGMTAVIGDYNPVSELENIRRQLESFVFRGDEEAALDFVVELDDAKRRAAVAIMQEIDRYYIKFIKRLKDFENFFSRENIELLRQYGNHPHNQFSFDAKYEVIRGRPRITFHYQGRDHQLVIGNEIENANFNWEAASYR